MTQHVSIVTNGYPVATPDQMVLAWTIGVMYGSMSHAKTEVKDHPIPAGLIDPTYHRDQYRTNGGWSTARGIRSASAIASMRGYLVHTLKVVPPPEVELAWARTVERDGKYETVKKTVMHALDDAFHDDTVETTDDFAQHVVRALQDL
jgi:hypothetical protein